MSSLGVRSSTSGLGYSRSGLYRALDSLVEVKVVLCHLVLVASVGDLEGEHTLFERGASNDLRVGQQECILFILEKGGTVEVERDRLFGNARSMDPGRLQGCQGGVCRLRHPVGLIQDDADGPVVSVLGEDGGVQSGRSPP